MACALPVGNLRIIIFQIRTSYTCNRRHPCLHAEVVMQPAVVSFSKVPASRFCLHGPVMHNGKPEQIPTRSQMLCVSLSLVQIAKTSAVVRFRQESCVRVYDTMATSGHVTRYKSTPIFHHGKAARAGRRGHMACIGGPHPPFILRAVTEQRSARHVLLGPAKKHAARRSSRSFGHVCRAPENTDNHEMKALPGLGDWPHGWQHHAMRSYFTALPLTSNTCGGNAPGCGRPVDPSGDQAAACPRTELLARLAKIVEHA